MYPILLEQGGLDYMISRGLFQPHSFCNLVTNFKEIFEMKLPESIKAARKFVVIGSLDWNSCNQNPI